MDRRLREYQELWESERARMAPPYAGSPARDLDLNISFPRDWKFGPPPAGYGDTLAGYDPSRTQDIPGFWNVTTRWVQQQLRNAGYSLTVDGRYGPQTAGTLLLFIRDRLRQPVAGFTSGNMASIQQAIERLPDAYSFGVYREGDRMSLSTLLERYLEPIQPQPRPGGSGGSTGSGGSASGSSAGEAGGSTSEAGGMAGALLPLALVGAGIFFLFRPRR